MSAPEHGSDRADDLAARGALPRRGRAPELWRFLRHNKKWWLTPIVVAILVLGLLAIFGGRGTAPFVYTLF